MILNRQLRTSKRIWLSISIPLFVAAWFLRGGKGGDEPMWELWRVLIMHDYICSDLEMLGFVVGLTFIFAAPAALVGWILQFPVCMAMDYFGRDKRKHENKMAQQ